MSYQMNYQDSSSDDVPYLPPDQYQNYQDQQRTQRLSQSQPSLFKEDQRRGRSFFTEDELRELDSPPGSDASYIPPVPTGGQIPRPPSSVYHYSDPGIHRGSATMGQDEKGENLNANNFAILQLDNDAPTQVPVQVRLQGHERNGNYDEDPNLNHNHNQSYINYSANNANHSNIYQKPEVSWGRRLIGILLITIPAVFFSVAAHFVDWSMSDFQLFSSSFFIFQGVFWPSLGILVADVFCKPKQKRSSSSSLDSPVQKVRPGPATEIQVAPKRKLTRAILVFVQTNLAATATILQLLSIQHLNITLSLALSFGFEVIIILIRYILEERRWSPELILLTLVSYCGYGVAAVPAFVSENEDARRDAAIGVGASVGVMLLSVPASFLLTYLRKNGIRDSELGTSFAFFGCIQSLITKEIMGRQFNIALDGRAAGWVAGLISVVFLGTIFLYLESRLSELIWKRDEDDDEEEKEKSKEFSSITRTRLAVFILSCLFELSRQAFRDTSPDPYDIFGGFLVIFCFLLAGGFQAWYYNNRHRPTPRFGLDRADSSEQEQEQSCKPRFCAFVPWLFAQHQRKKGK